MTTNNPSYEGFDPARGTHVKGHELTEDSFQGKSAFDQLRAITRHPAELQQGARRTGYDADIVAEEAEIHALIQRAMVGAKKRNVKGYAQYIRAVVLGLRKGVLPPIHLWSPSPLDVIGVGTHTYAVVPNGSFLMAIDGETQLSAHYEAHRDLPPELREQHGRYPLGVIIHHGVDVPTARQLFHDLNVLAVRPNVSLSLSMDSSDPLMTVVDHLEAAVPSFTNRVEHQKRQLTKSSPKVITTQSLRQMVINVAKGVGGVQYGARPVSLDDVDVDDLERVAGSWLGGYFEAFALEIADREGTIAGTPAVLAAVGALGRMVMDTPPPNRAAEQARLLASLREVDWRKGEHWVGIAGANKARGFSVNSPKEAAYNIYGALVDPQNVNYARIRKVSSTI